MMVMRSLYAIVSKPINTVMTMVKMMIRSSTIFSFHVWTGRFKEIKKEEKGTNSG